LQQTVAALSKVDRRSSVIETRIASAGIVSVGALAVMGSSFDNGLRAALGVLFGVLFALCFAAIAVSFGLRRYRRDTGSSSSFPPIPANVYVESPNGDAWKLRRHVELRFNPVKFTEFEHDVDGGRSSVYFASISLLLCWAAVVGLFYQAKFAVYLPWWIIICLFALPLTLLFRWAVSRTWIVVAEQVIRGSQYALPGASGDLEYWVGAVIGRSRSIEVMRAARKQILSKGTPSEACGLSRVS
jgi:hypothetical protein